MPLGRIRARPSCTMPMRPACATVPAAHCCAASRSTATGTAHNVRPTLEGGPHHDQRAWWSPSHDARVTLARGRRGSDAAQGQHPHRQRLDGGGVDGGRRSVSAVLRHARLSGDLRGEMEER
jgi:hypothetical protein